jgi:hypothetical protein
VTLQSRFLVEYSEVSLVLKLIVKSIHKYKCQNDYISKYFYTRQVTAAATHYPKFSEVQLSVKKAGKDSARKNQSNLFVEEAY